MSSSAPNNDVPPPFTPTDPDGAGLSRTRLAAMLVAALLTVVAIVVSRPEPGLANPGAVTLPRHPDDSAGATGLARLATSVDTSNSTVQPTPPPPAAPEPSAATPRSTAAAATPTPVPVATRAARDAGRGTSAPAVATVVIQGLPHGATITLDGRLHASGLLSLDPGRHVIATSARGFEPRADTVVLKPGEHRNIRMRLQPIQAPTQVASGRSSASGRGNNPRSSRELPRERACADAVTAADWARAHDACAAAAVGGSAAAARRVGEMFREGQGVRRSDDSAYAWFRRGAEMGDAASMFAVGDALEHGHGVRKDQTEAVRWYTRAATQGVADAQYALGAAYEKGRLGLSKDRKAALEWYQKAAAQGHKEAAKRVTDLNR